MPASLTGGFQHAFWVLGAIGLIAVPAIFATSLRSPSGELVPHSVSPLVVEDGEIIAIETFRDDAIAARFESRVR